jgi:hypothetical protein
MKTSHSKLGLIFSGDTVLLFFSVVLFLASLSSFVPTLRAFGVFGVLTPLLGAAFLILCCVQLAKYQRLLRTVISAIFFLAATVISLYTILHATGRIH